MAFSDTAKNAALDALGAIGVKMSLHSADPGTTGASEITGGSYTKETCAWAAASAGSMALSGSVVFDVPSGQAPSWAGVWKTDGTTFLFGINLPDETFSIDGTYTVTTATTVTA